jgi:CubicO group peptidase (beta-lactamase class C family)
VRAACALGAAVIAALILAGCADGPGGTRGAADPVDASIQRVLDDALPDGASGTLVAARDGEMVHCRGFGIADREAGSAATCDTAYDVMSMTKQFTAAAILKLEMMGRLETSDPIGEHLGPVPADKRAITVHHLLTHTAGFAEAVGDDYERRTREALLAAAMRSRLRSPPGTRYRYSNLGYSVLAAIVEEASGMGYERFLATHLLGPAGMTRTGYVLPDWDAGRIAVEYDPRGASHGTPLRHRWAADGPWWNLRGNGGLLSTARDMFRWHLALQGDEVLDRRAKRKLFTAHVREEPGGDSRYGYGWVIARTDLGRVAWHDGGNGWSYGVLTRLLDRDAMVFWVTNRRADAAGGWDLERRAPDVTDGVVAGLLGRS